MTSDSIEAAAMFSALRVSATQVDAGALAEALVYYSRVDLTLRGQMLGGLVQKFGPDNLFRCIDMGGLRLFFHRHLLAVHTEERPPQRHSFQSFFLVGKADGANFRHPSDEVEWSINETFGKSKEARQIARKLIDRITFEEGNSQVLQDSFADVKNISVLHSAMENLLREMLPGTSLPDLNLDVFDMGDGSIIFTANLDYQKINKIYHKTTPIEHSSITGAFLLSHVLSARDELVAAGESQGDVWMDDRHAAVSRALVHSIGHKLNSSITDNEYFHQLNFEGRTFREAINHGECKVDDIVSLLEDETTKKMKKWISAQNNDSSIVEEYHKAIFGEPAWRNSLHSKLGKLVIFGGAGLLIDVVAGLPGVATGIGGTVGPILADLGLSATDEFLLSKIRLGWSPNQFVEGPARNLLARK